MNKYNLVYIEQGHYTKKYDLNIIKLALMMFDLKLKRIYFEIEKVI